MSRYLNCAFDDGERLAVEVASVQGWVTSKGGPIPCRMTSP